MAKILSNTAPHTNRMMMQKRISLKLCTLITSTIITTALAAWLMTVNACYLFARLKHHVSLALAGSRFSSSNATCRFDVCFRRR